MDASAPWIAHLNAYTTRYMGSFTYSSQNQAKVADGQPCFRATIGYTACSQILTLYSLRRVTINGAVETTERGPLRL